MPCSPISCRPPLPRIDLQQARQPGAGARRRASTLNVGQLSSAASRLQHSSQTGRAASAPRALCSALAKLDALRVALASCDSLESALCNLLGLQTQDSNQRSQEAIRAVQDKFRRLRAQTQQRMRAIQQRLEARKAKGSWDKLLKVVKIVAGVAAAAGAAFTGGTLGVVAGLLLASALVVGQTCTSEAGQWVSFGLSLAGAACTFGAALAGKVALCSLNQASQTASGAANVARGGALLGRAGAERDVLRAEVRLNETSTARARLRDGVQRQLEQLRRAVETLDSTSRHTRRSLETHLQCQRTALA